MKLYSEANISALMSALEADEYDDAQQNEELGIVTLDSLFAAVIYNLLPSDGEAKVLEIGCGSGEIFTLLPITHAIEPSRGRFKAAKEAGGKQVEVRREVVEAMSYGIGFFDMAIMLNGFFQVRSDYEALMEVNRVLRKGGHFILNLLTNDSIDIVQGRCYGWNNFLRTATQFGFRHVAYFHQNAGPRFYPQKQVSTLVVLEKAMEFSPELLNLPQAHEKDIRNFFLPRDWRLP